MIVESDDLIRKLIEGWLSEAGYSVITGSRAAPRPKEAPSLVIANVSTPRGDSALLRSLNEEYGAPVLVVSARFRRGLGASQAAARQLGVRKVLPKPFTREELLTAVGECMAE
jgi:DNA-binding response OmpR family regulator